MDQKFIILRTRFLSKNLIPPSKQIWATYLVSKQHYTLKRYPSLHEIAVGVGFNWATEFSRKNFNKLQPFKLYKEPSPFYQSAYSAILPTHGYIIAYPMILLYHSYLMRRMRGDEVMLTDAAKELLSFAREKQGTGSGGGISSLWTGCLSGAISYFLDTWIAEYVASGKFSDFERLSVTLLRFAICDVILRNITLQMQILNMSNTSINDSKNRSKSLFSCVRNIYAEEGIPGFFRGWMQQAGLNILLFLCSSLGVSASSCLSWDMDDSELKELEDLKELEESEDYGSFLHSHPIPLGSHE
eukprot:gb/GECH01015021.1/.p1 GENE.gb/GECH01015021.1/~~gb/GECH01015021.1/.p1  ORF type:complete len:300 (+),score=48.12 gb/GECH01015021.1/:1-900(+)